MVEHAGAGPQSLDTRLRTFDAAAGFSGYDDAAYLRLRQVDVFFRGRFAQPQCVGRGAAQCSDLVVENRVQAGAASHSTPGNGEAAHARRRVKSNPEAQERTK